MWAMRTNRHSSKTSLCYVGALIRKVRQVLFVYVSPCLFRSCGFGTLGLLLLSLMKPAHGKLCDQRVKRSARSGHMFTWI